ncbi:MAG: hypothetical protein AB7E80_14645 [Hyphomicrobiaceae bacterium]
MKIIAVVALLAVTLLPMSGALPEASVGAAMTLTLLFLIAALAVGIFEAWSMRRGLLGWIVSIVAAVVGGFVGASIGAMILDISLTLLQPEGPLMQTRHPLLYVSLNGQMLCTLAGAWIALWLVNRLRSAS